MDTGTIIQNYIVDEILMRKKRSVGIDQSLIGSGILDSLTLLQLISFVEKRFGVQITDREMIPDNFQTIARIKALIESKQNAANESASTRNITERAYR